MRITLSLLMVAGLVGLASSRPGFLGCDEDKWQVGDRGKRMQSKQFFLLREYNLRNNTSLSFSPTSTI